LRRDVVGAEVNAVGSDGKDNVRAGVDEQASSQFPVLSSQFCDYGEGFSSEKFQLSRGQVFFAKLDVVDSGADSLGDFFKETAAARGFVWAEGSAVGDVVEKAAFSHQLSAVRKMPGCARRQPRAAVPT
jgi:hypothetical protein